MFVLCYPRFTNLLPIVLESLLVPISAIESNRRNVPSGKLSFVMLYRVSIKQLDSPHRPGRIRPNSSPSISCIMTFRSRLPKIATITSMFEAEYGQHEMKTYLKSKIGPLRPEKVR
jgi:hypothetical protein